ncbi:MAG TPA: hypothetical protein PLS53_11805 [Thermoanaerobaculaceae bacterium]|nr:hypothetical protein [Thermoanaerobaculaceae bacterium]HPS78832.1 hypothetical protein [Thermoanaerobaculaceae bacterium]
MEALLERAAGMVDALYDVDRPDAAEKLDALLADVEELFEDTGDHEEGADLEDDLLSEVDEDGAHELATELPEDEVHDDDLDFAYERGRYAPERCARFHDETDGDLDFAYDAFRVP